jgi:hypothetical protein
VDQAIALIHLAAFPTESETPLLARPLASGIGAALSEFIELNRNQLLKVKHEHISPNYFGNSAFLGA